MSFNSFRFILTFFPIFVLLYFLAAKKSARASRLVLILGSAVFYAYAGWQASLLLALSLAVNLLLALWIVREQREKAPLVIGIVLNLGLLFSLSDKL